MKRWPCHTGVPAGHVTEVPFLHHEIIGQVRREHRRTVHVLTIHPSWEVSHGCGEVVSCQLTQNSSRKAMSKTNLQESLKRRPNRKQLCSRKPGQSRRPLKLHGKPAKQEALVIHILDCTSWHRGESGVRWAGDETRWDGWGEIGRFCSGGKLACHSRDSNFMIFRHKGTQRLSSRTHIYSTSGSRQKRKDDEAVPSP